MTQPATAHAFYYFDEPMLSRQRLLWAIATRRQLERWEALLAAEIRDGFARRKTPVADIWASSMEHHFALVAAKHLIRALELPPAATITVDPTLRSELIEGRDLHEHWDENMPVFNVTPRVAQPRYPTGKSFAARNPDGSPYSWFSFDSKKGPLLLPNVSAFDVHELLDEVERVVMASNSSLANFVPPRASSPWKFHDGNWWPKA
jgi:hypothetical protein